MRPGAGQGEDPKRQPRPDAESERHVPLEAPAERDLAERAPPVDIEQFVLVRRQVGRRAGGDVLNRGQRNNLEECTAAQRDDVTPRLGVNCRNVTDVEATRNCGEIQDEPVVAGMLPGAHIHRR